MYEHEDRITAPWLWTVGIVYLISAIALAGVFMYNHEHGTYKERHPEVYEQLLGN
ncbi:hypothetical protein [Rhodococcus artemisiae]|uniref:Uncharacterized protein n=1 Tax=Rhodococcus artemisiae TaxID=714159 RepID=A0ABU7LDL2_9NOCA|nr:hypothetical protein [Rhodococcus artemisiae]MEE2058992.1 hypothetical protein [Rhodococcus artemisiae]